MSEFDNEDFDPPPFDTGAPSAPSVQLVRGSSIEPLHVSWLWPDYLARGKLHILRGGSRRRQDDAGAANGSNCHNGRAMARRLTLPGWQCRHLERRG